MKQGETSLRVELLSWTGGELTVALAAKLCYSSSDIAELKETISQADQTKFIGMVTSMGHHSVLEHISFTFGIEGVSRALTHQLVRHRIASYSQKSQRYVSHSEGFQYVVPVSISSHPVALKRFEKMMQEIASCYDDLEQMGVTAEDARYVLPNACESKIIVTMNARELLHFFKVRCCERAQWEIKAMAVDMLIKAKSVAPSIFLLAGPACVSGGCSEGKMSCGKAKEIREFFKNLTAL